MSEGGIAMPSKHLALLRGINVGGKNKLPMKDLIRIFRECGCERVRNYIQSGNILFDAGPDVLAGLASRVEGHIDEQFGFRPPVVLRTEPALASVIAGNPFLAEGAAPDALHVYFLAGPADPDRIGQLDPDRSPPDRFAVRGGEVYLHLPDGMARTRLTNAYFDSKLATTSTARNWRTACKLLDMMRE